jgi:hypothetical protein
MPPPTVMQQVRRGGGSHAEHVARLEQADGAECVSRGTRRCRWVDASAYGRGNEVRYAHRILVPFFIILFLCVIQFFFFNRVARHAFFHYRGSTDHRQPQTRMTC